MSTVKTDVITAVSTNGDLSLDGLGTGGVSIASTLKMTKGGDIASASPLVIDTDGNYFDVTGTTNFAAMTVEAGNFFMLQFDGALTITHGSGIELPGAANLTTAAGDRLICYATAADTVEVMNVATEAAAAGGVDVQSFTSSGTWTKPAAGISCAMVRIWGSGGGGGSGRRAAAGGGRSGGSGAGGGGYNEMLFLNADLGSTETVTIAAGGAGAAGQSSNDTDGIQGTAGSNSTFGSLLSGFGGGSGGKGQSTSGSEGGAGGGGALGVGGNAYGNVQSGGIPRDGDNEGSNPSHRGFGGGRGSYSTSTTDNPGHSAWGGGGGSASNPGTVSNNAGAALFGGGGGGAGGGISTGNTDGTGGFGGASGGKTSTTSDGSRGSGGGTNAGGAGTAGVGANGGGGGGGGGSYQSGTAGAGGAGAQPGGAGGGGGASTNGNASGAGGTGGDGKCIVLSW